MKVIVTKVVETHQAASVPIPTVSDPDRTMPGRVENFAEVEVLALVESKSEVSNWKASVGKTLHLGPIAQDGWYDRCEAYYVPDDGREPERCAFPSLRCPVWYMHPDAHESRTWTWGDREVRELKETRRDG